MVSQGRSGGLFISAVSRLSRPLHWKRFTLKCHQSIHHFFFLKVKWFNWWQICCVLNAPFFPAGCCALFESVPAVVVCERKWCFHSVKRLNIPPNKVFHSSTWLVHSLWWLNEVTWQCRLLLDIFSLL